MEINLPLLGDTVGNDWERGFATGVRMAEAGAVRMAQRLVDELTPSRAPRTVSEMELVRLLRSIERLLSKTPPRQSH